MKQPEVTCILTSCGRFDLLRRTLESFFVHNTYDITKFIISDDSRQPIPMDLINDFPFVKWTTPSQEKNQIASLDFLWWWVKTPYAMTLEDDWEFLRPGFIEASMAVLETNPDILQCWLMHPEEHNVQPIEWVSEQYGILKSSGGLWGGTRFNPALKRKSDYDLIAPFSKHTTWNPERPWKSEADISKVYHKLGFKGAVLSGPDYIKHIGQNQHVGP